MEQGIHDHFGCDLSDLESILDPGCPGKTKKPSHNVCHRSILSVKGGGQGGFPPSSAGEAEAILKERHIPRLLWMAYPQVRKSDSPKVQECP